MGSGAVGGIKPMLIFKVHTIWFGIGFYTFNKK
jgi:hypothetical protein